MCIFVNYYKYITVYYIKWIVMDNKNNDYKYFVRVI